MNNKKLKKSMGACAPAVKLRACHAPLAFHSKQLGFSGPS